MKLSRPQIAALMMSVVVFFLPVHPRILPPLLLILFIYSFFIAGWTNRFREMLRNPAFGLFAAFYLITLLGMVWTSSEGMKPGWKMLETKLAFFFVPFIIFTLPAASIPHRDALKKYFILGVCFSLLLCTGFGIWHLIDERIDMANGIPRDNFRHYWFFSDRLSIFFHPTYLSLYCNLALAFVLIHPARNLFSPVKQLLIIMLLMAGIFMLASKAGLITMVALMIVFAFRLIFREKKILPALAGIVAVMLLFATAYFTIGEFRNKIRMAVSAVKGNNSENKAESSAMRMEVWKASVDVALKNLPAGTGTGDSRSELMKAYSERGLQAELEHKLNSHNQFIEVTVSLGLPGFLVLAGWYLFFQLHFIRKKQFDGTWILFLFLFNTMVECMLELQGGVMFFAFFVPVFYRYTTTVTDEK